MTLAGMTCVTAHIGSVDFKEPIPVGHVAEMTAYVYQTGDTSIRTYVMVDHRDPRTQILSTATEAHFVFVAVDEAGEPQSVPDIQLTTQADQRLLEMVPY